MEAVACQRIVALQEPDPTHLRHDNDGASHPAVRTGAAADRIESVAEHRLETHHRDPPLRPKALFDGYKIRQIPSPCPVFF